MEYNRQVPVGGIQAAEAAKASGTAADNRDMAFGTLTITEKNASGQTTVSNVRQGCLLLLLAKLPANCFAGNTMQSSCYLRASTRPSHLLTAFMQPACAVLASLAYRCLWSASDCLPHGHVW